MKRLISGIILCTLMLTSVLVSSATAAEESGEPDLYALLDRASWITGIFDRSSVYPEDWQDKSQKMYITYPNEPKNKVEYFRCVGEIDSMEKVRAYISDYFSEELVNKIFIYDERYRPVPTFIEENGVLYYCYGMEVMQLYAYDVQAESRVIEVLSRTDNKITFRMTQNVRFTSPMSDDPPVRVSYDYTVERVGDRFVFTKYAIPMHLPYDTLNEVNPNTGDSTVPLITGAACLCAFAILVKKKRTV